ncbi:phage tail protein [Methylomonas sp. EFPC1]|uniref:phage tail protein n=1 Tax=Methylomonas sp. EFPC1 TaxID=2812647 RepID=UPI00196709D6|nr:phage tail protein [Methylomonas sp. EFPC1]QSB00824.1 phage tail protein [Methylomonas sp. EFPC1]
MDVNNTSYFLLKGQADFEQGSSHLSWNAGLQALTLAQNQALRLPASDPAAALLAWQNSAPLALDSFNQIGRLSDDGTRVEFNSGRGYLTLQDNELRDVVAPQGLFTDMAFAAVASSGKPDFGQPAGDGRLALPFSDGNNQHGLLLFHLARRWQTFCAWGNAEGEDAASQMPVRACVDAEQRIWLISNSGLMLCSGEALPLPYTPQPVRFEPEQANPHPLNRIWQQALPEGMQALALCCDLQQIFILCHDGMGAQAIVTRPLSALADAPFKAYACPAELPFAIDLALAADSALPDSGRLAALVPRAADDLNFAQRDCPVLTLHWDNETNTGQARLLYERYPMLSQAVSRFVSSADGQLRYQAEADPDFPQIVPRPRELHALRRPQFHLEGTALLHELDSGQVDTQWHRLYLDACIPPGCDIQIAVRVFASRQAVRPKPIEQPAPLWNPLPSELPFAASLAGQQLGTSGLFEILLQQPTGPVRQLRGRYLQIQVTLRGDGRQSPALHAIRVYYPRFSYQEAYFPEFYRQELSYDPAQAVGPANGADVRERLLAAFEGVLTPLEGRIAASEQLLAPEATPVANLPWLAEAVGGRLPSHWPEARQRRWLRDLTLIQQYKGTLAGLNLALDIVSDGGVQRGEIVVLENFRLRRTMATILGIDMDDGDHPLTLGTGMSGNSIVGDSLILSESDARQFLALFAPELATVDEAAQVKAFFEEYAHQVSILLHGRAVSLRTAVEDILTEQLPAHLQYRIIETEHPFVLGIAPLLGMDTFIETAPPFRRVTLDDTYLGREGILKNPAAFSPEDINAQA